MSNTKITMAVLDESGDRVYGVEFTNEATPFGKASLNVMTEAPDFPTAKIIIGSGYDSNRLDIQQSVDGAIANVSLVTTIPTDTATTPVLRTRTLSHIFGPYAEVTTISEIGIGDSSTQMCTYAGVRDHNDQPLAIKLKVGERLFVTYMYQIASFAYLPPLLGITGDGVDEGTLGCIYRTVSDDVRGYYYYQTMDDFNDSAWGDNYNNFYKDDLFNSPYATFGSAAFQDLANAGASSGVHDMNTNHNGRFPHLKTVGAGKDNFSAHDYFLDFTKHYIVGFRLDSDYCVLLNKPIVFKLGMQIKAVDGIPFEVNTKEFIDPGSID